MFSELCGCVVITLRDPQKSNSSEPCHLKTFKYLRYLLVDLDKKTEIQIGNLAQGYMATQNRGLSQGMRDGMVLRDGNVQ